MIRGFQTFEVRKTQELNGLWEMEILNGTGAVTEQTKFLMMVPGCAQSLPGLENFRGRCRYERAVELDAGGTIRLVFYGVSFMADIYWDGKRITSHYNAYTEFDVIIQNQEKGRHRLEVFADNSWNEELSALHIPNDYQSYNGISQTVWERLYTARR